ncbi:MAG: 30S ribosomal protein S27e [Candidatus Diapherotrites archaeon]|nr:30S ribosomal protein S27e [Candidatus Diapherotrites archaeon]
MDVSIPKSRFLKVKCFDCSKEQVIFGCASTGVNCVVCGKKIVAPKGGKASIKTRIIDVLE